MLRWGKTLELPGSHHVNQTETNLKSLIYFLWMGNNTLIMCVVVNISKHTHPCLAFNEQKTLVDFPIKQNSKGNKGQRNFSL